MTPGLQSFFMLLGAVALALLLVWLRYVLATRRARRLNEEAKAIRLRQRIERQKEYRKLANPIDWKPTVNGLDTIHLEVRENVFIEKESP